MESAGAEGAAHKAQEEGFYLTILGPADIQRPRWVSMNVAVGARLTQSGSGGYEGGSATRNTFISTTCSMWRCSGLYKAWVVKCT